MAPLFHHSKTRKKSSNQKSLHLPSAKNLHPPGKHLPTFTRTPLKLALFVRSRAPRVLRSTPGVVAAPVSRAKLQNPEFVTRSSCVWQQIGHMRTDLPWGACISLWNIVRLNIMLSCLYFALRLWFRFVFFGAGLIPGRRRRRAEWRAADGSRLLKFKLRQRMLSNSLG